MTCRLRFAVFTGGPAFSGPAFSGPAFSAPPSKSKPDVEFQYSGRLGEFKGMSSQQQYNKVTKEQDNKAYGML